jgi:hypothetical protein
VVRKNLRWEAYYRAGARPTLVRWGRIGVATAKRVSKVMEKSACLRAAHSPTCAEIKDYNPVLSLDILVCLGEKSTDAQLFRLVYGMEAVRVPWEI